MTLQQPFAERRHELYPYSSQILNLRYKLRQKMIAPTFPEEPLCPLPLPGRQVPFQHRLSILIHSQKMQ